MEGSLNVDSFGKLLLFSYSILDMLHDGTGLEIATDTGAFATKIFAFATKISR